MGGAYERRERASEALDHYDLLRAMSDHICAHFRCVIIMLL